MAATADNRELERRRMADDSRDRALRWLAWSACGVSLLIVALALLVISLGWFTGSTKGGTPWQGQAIFAFGMVGASLLGGLIASRRPENPYGWLWLGYGIGFAISSLAEAYISYAAVASQSKSLPVPWPIILMSGLGWGVSVTLLPFLLLLFPDGKLPSPRWRFVAWAYGATGVLILILAPFRPGWEGVPLGVEGPTGEAIAVVTSIGVNVIFGAVALSALSLVFRYLGADGIRRQQLKWFAYAAAVLGAYMIGDLLGLFRPLGATLWSILGSVSFTILYVAVGVAILKYRLYDIDRIINRTLVYGALTGILALVYLGSVTATQAVLQTSTGREELPQLVIVASTLVIAALFSPLKRFIQSFIDRRFYRSKYDARKTLETFSTRLRDETDLEALNGELVGVVRETMQPAHAGLWLKEPQHKRDSPRDDPRVPTTRQARDNNK
jgi:hypothetical protein